ncbi:hypothetical protein MMC13_006946 [Lambiella insularis]|nr:hypothetical protein [Lambiella insularis]
MGNFDEELKTAANPGPGRKIPGAVLLAADRSGQILYHKVEGFTSLDDSVATPLTADSTFCIASCTKLLTTICALQCVEKGLLALDDDVSTVLPELETRDILTGFTPETKEPILRKASKKITLRQLLTHSSGMGYDFLSPALKTWSEWANGGQASVRKGEILKDYDMPLLYEPGEEWEYSCGIDWAGLMVERVSGVRLGMYMNEHVWEPLGMHSTTFQLFSHKGVQDHLCSMTARSPTGELLAAPPYRTQDPKDDLGGGGIYTSPHDYIKVLIAILQNDGKILKRESVELMFQPQLSNDTALKSTVLGDAGAMYRGGVASDAWNFGLGGILNMDDVDEICKKGTMTWSGLPNLYWWIDPAIGTCGFYASQSTTTVAHALNQTPYSKPTAKKAHSPGARKEGKGTPLRKLSVSQEMSEEWANAARLSAAAPAADGDNIDNAAGTVYHKTFRRAASILRTALGVEGVLFADGVVGLHGGLLPASEPLQELQREAKKGSEETQTEGAETSGSPDRMGGWRHSSNAAMSSIPKLEGFGTALDRTKRTFTSASYQKSVSTERPAEVLGFSVRASCFAWSMRVVPVFTEEADLGPFKAFLHSVEAEVSRVDTVAAAEQREAFVSSVSHELRCPLHGILGAAELLNDTNIDSFQQELATPYARVVIGSAHSYTTSAVGLVEYSNKRADKPTTDEPLEPTCKESRADDFPILTLDVAYEQNWNLMTEPGALRRVMTNLIGNALKYSPRGVVHVSLNIEQSDNGKEKTADDGSPVQDVIFTVKDSGKGMSRHFIDNHLFLPFSQEDAIASSGVGLGMSIVKSLVSLLGGQIEVESQVGKGTEVKVIVPMTANRPRSRSTSPSGSRLEQDVLAL